MSTETGPTTPSDGGPGAREWLRPAALVLACLVIGFVGGWVVRGDSGAETVLAPAAPGQASDAGPDAGAGAGTTAATGTATAPAPATTPATPPPPPARSEVAVAVLNATTQAGFAASTAAQAESLGYQGVTAGNAPSGTTGPSTVYFGAGQRPAAERVSRDLEIERVASLPTGALTDAAAGADVVVVLGSG